MTSFSYGKKFVTAIALLAQFVSTCVFAEDSDIVTNTSSFQEERTTPPSRWASYLGLDANISTRYGNRDYVYTQDFSISYLASYQEESERFIFDIGAGLGISQTNYVYPFLEFAVRYKIARTWQTGLRFKAPFSSKPNEFRPNLYGIQILKEFSILKDYSARAGVSFMRHNFFDATHSLVDLQLSF